MSAGVYVTAAFSAALGGFTALSLAMDRHYEDSFGRGRTAGRWLPWLRAVGVLGLAVSLWACLGAQGTSQGWVLYGGVLTVAALAVVLVLTYAPGRATWLVVGGMGMSALMGLLTLVTATFRSAAG
ncbi:MAG: iron uptake protein [Rhodoferax sp.]|nr:iron uptake protein [Rhodoferax sp.]